MTLKYSVNQKSISNLLALVDGGNIAIPEIQRPFVWERSKVRDFLDSLYRGFPVGYIITWQNPSVRLKDNKKSNGKQVLIDGQQRITALTTAILGQKIINADYKQDRIKIAFNPSNDIGVNEDSSRIFEVHNAAIEKSHAWIKDVGPIINNQVDILSILKEYCRKNDVDEAIIFEKLQRLLNLQNAQIGVIDLNSDISIDEVTEIFIRINSRGADLSQADFAMSKIAANEELKGSAIRKSIDYFCHAAIKPDFVDMISERDQHFAETELFQNMRWLKSIPDNTYSPKYSDMLRVSFTSQFKRGKLADLVSLLSGRNFETRDYEQEIVEETFSQLQLGIYKFSNKYNFQGFVMLVKSAGFESPKQIRSQMVLNFAYIVYLMLLETDMPKPEKEKFVQKWLVMSILTGRYSSSPESAMDRDIKMLSENDPLTYLKTIEDGDMSDAFWNVSLVQYLGYAATTNPQFNVFLAAQVHSDDYAFLSSTIKVRQLLEDRGDVHHLFPKDYLIKKGKFSRGKYNQIANYTYTQSEINRAIGNAPPIEYMDLVRQAAKAHDKSSSYSSILNEEQLLDNLKQHCIPDNFHNLEYDKYEEFLLTRQKLIAQRLKTYYFSL